MSSAKIKELLSSSSRRWIPVILTYQDFPNVESWSHGPNGQRGRKWVFQASGGGGSARSTADLPWRWLNQCCHLKGEAYNQAQMIIKRHPGVDLLPSWPLEKDMLRVTSFTEHCSLFSWEATRRKILCRCEWCVVSWAPPLSPATPPPELPPVLPPGPFVWAQVVLHPSSMRELLTFKLSVHPPCTER